MSEEIKEEEISEEEAEKKFGNPNLKIVFDQDGNPMLSCEPIRTKIPPKNTVNPFPFNNILEQKKQHMDKVIEELRKRFAIPPNQVLPFEFFYIEFKEENDDNCESE